MKALIRFIHHKGNPKVVYDYLASHTSKQTNQITYREALANRDHRHVTLILSFLILMVGFTGVY
jgi:hypothetical protein